MNEISNRIRERRNVLGITQAELGRKVGVSDVSILRWEKGIRVPNASMMPKLAEALNTSVEYLMGLEKVTNGKSGIDFSVNKVEDENKVGMSYWGGVADNAHDLAESGDKEKMIYVAFILKNALSSLLNKAGVNETGVQNFYMSNWNNNKIMNSIFGQGTVAYGGSENA